MVHVNEEIKARISEDKEKEIRNYLLKFATKLEGIDFQTDSYFKVDEGYMKLRKGNIENALIFYKRENEKGPKLSKPEIHDLMKNSYLERITRKTYDLLIEVKKRREIYSIDNVKFNIDEVKNLDCFIEIKAQSELDEETGKPIIPLEKLKEQCNHYKNLFKIKRSDLIENSYSDIMLELKEMQKTKLK